MESTFKDWGWILTGDEYEGQIIIEATTVPEDFYHSAEYDIEVDGKVKWRFYLERIYDWGCCSDCPRRTYIPKAAEVDVLNYLFDIQL